MKDTVYRFSLDIHKTQSQVSLSVPQDTARVIYATLTEAGMTYQFTDECHAVFTAAKPDGTTIHNDCAIINGSIIQYEFTAQTTAAVGIVECSIEIYGYDKKRLASPRFSLVVYEDTVGDIELSEDEKTVLDGIMEDELDRHRAEEFRVSEEEKRATAETARIEAETQRAEAENSRATSESARVEAESKRATAESARTEAESKRVNAESARVEAETARNKTVSEMLEKNEIFKVTIDKSVKQQIHETLKDVNRIGVEVFDDTLYLTFDETYNTVDVSDGVLYLQ